tara:strand:+ start:178 stop:402 length:225 start_codon:yes stop_codon:yes gene_type:complete
MSKEAQGTVKWFNGKKGYGFITDDADSQEYFVHFGDIQATGYKTLEANQKVSFHPETGDKGLKAANVIILETAV